MLPSSARLVITGANGYIGKILLARVMAEGFPVTVMTRHPQAFANTPLRVIPFQLGDTLSAALFNENDIVVHLASACMNSSADEKTAQLDISGTQKLLDATRAARVRRFIFISSQSATAKAPTAYGRSKWHIEQLMTETHEIIVRPGLVYGKEAVGLFGTLCKLVQQLPLFPNINLDKPIQPIHVTELCDAIAKLLNQRLTSRTFNVGFSHGIPFKKFLSDLAHYKFNKKIHFIKIPLFLVNWGCALSRFIPFLPTLSSDRVTGFTQLNAMETKQSLQTLNVTLQEPFVFFKQESNVVMQEGKALFHYLGHRNPSETLLNHYAAFATETLLPPLFVRWPRLIRWIEPIGSISELAQRLQIATHLLETEVSSAALFWNLNPQSKARIYGKLLGVMLLEIIALPFRLMARFVFRIRQENLTSG